jgi:signal transduction histidine kinase/ActR/RegA family two-component response regulator
MLFILKDHPFSKKDIPGLNRSRSTSEKPTFPGMNLNPITLAFSGKQAYLEPFFFHSYTQKYLQYGRICHILVILINVIWGLVDYLVFPSMVKECYIIRFGILTPFFLLGLFFSFYSGYLRYWQYLFAFDVIVSGILQISMIWMGQSSDLHAYYAGIIVILFFGYAFIRLRFIFAVISCWSVMIMYILFAAFISPISSKILIFNSIFIFSINLIGMIICYTTEIDSRRNFFLSWLLEQEQEKVTGANQMLEKSVAKRTAELSLINSELKREFEAHRKVIEDKQLLEQQFLQAQKMEAIGTLAGGIAHDFNNILSAIMGFTELTISDIPKEGQLTDNLNEVLVACGRARDLISQILTFSRRSKTELRPIPLTLVAKEIVKLLRATLPATIEIKQNFASNRLIMADATQIHQLIMNLCTNASHAMQKSGGILSLFIMEYDLDERSVSHLPELMPGRYLKLIVSDTGDGIPENMLERIFEPFFTTKKKEEGTGLGLSVVHGIVKSQNGAIRVESREGIGTTFSLYFPIVEHGDIKLEKIETQLTGGIEHILIIDDEPSIVKVESKMLERLGYKVTGQTNSVEALEMFKKYPDQFDLVITDLTMPYLTGEKLAAQIRKFRSDIPVILCTGFSTSNSHNEILASGITTIIKKPIVTQKLAKTIRKVLDEKPAPLHIKQEGPLKTRNSENRLL